MKPIRIQRKRTKGWKMPPNTIYVGRPSKWGNPFRGKWAVYDFTMMLNYKLRFEKDFGNELKELKGKNLACWCPLDKHCHADTLLDLANKTSI